MENNLRNKINEFRDESSIYPDKNKVHDFIKKLFDFLFVDNFSDEEFPRIISELKQNFLQIAGCGSGIVNKNPGTVAEDFFSNLEFVAVQCKKDADAILSFDPAARSINEVINIYPGYLAIAMYRIAHSMWELGMSCTARIVSEYVHSITGIDIHPAAKIGNSFAIDPRNRYSNR